jgi:hypothetical protein
MLGGQLVRYLVWVECSTNGITEGELEALADALTDLEAADEAISGTDIAATLSASRVDMQMCVIADDVHAALAKADATLRAAIQATGGAFTPDWEPVSLHAEQVAA